LVGGGISVPIFDLTSRAGIVRIHEEKVLQGREHIVALVRCPECRRSVSDKAFTCPHCGYPFRPSEDVPPDTLSTRMRGYEYKSGAAVFGLPLVHIVYGPGPGGRMKPAKGIIAVGNIAVGVIAVGGFSLGILSIAGFGIGLICFAGIALAVLGGVGGIAVGYVAVRGIAVSVYSIGGLAFGAHTIYNSPELREFMRSLLGMNGCR